MIRDAIISACSQYRYMLLRRWGEKPRSVTWIMLNPSTADAEVDDNTIRRCISFSKRKDLNYDSMVVVNLFALRATDPKHLLSATDPIGPKNNYWIQSACNRSDLFIAAWGAFPKAKSAVKNVVKTIHTNGYALQCLGTTKNGAPRHPLYLRSDAPLVEWKE